MLLLLLFATTRSVVKSVKVPVVEAAKRANRSHRIRHRSAGDKLVGRVVQVIVVFCSVSAPRPILGVDAPSVLCWFIVAE